VPKFRVEPRLSTRGVVFGDARDRRQEFIWLGVLAELGGDRVRVSIDVSAEHVVAIVGKRGSGKSFTLGVIAEALGASELEGPLGKIAPSHAVVLLDSLNIYWSTSRPVPLDPPAGAEPLHEQVKLLKTWKLDPQQISVALWSPAGFSPDYLGGEVSEFRFSLSEITSQDWADLFGVDIVRDPMGQAIDESWRKTTEEGWKRQDGTKVQPATHPTFQAVLDCLDNDTEMGRHFAPETLRAVQQRFRSLGRQKLFSAEGTALSELLEPGRVSVLLLGEVPDDLRRVFVSVLARRLLQERSVASGRAKREALGLGTSSGDQAIPPTWLLIDEAQNLLPAGHSTAATQALIRFVREGRNIGLSFGVATQQPNAVDAKIMAQVDTLIAHQLVTAKDVQVVTDNLKSPPPRSVSYASRSLRLAEAIPLLDVGQALVSSPELDRALFLAVRPRVSMHGGFEA
jgi:hypothetical protein